MKSDELSYKIPFLSMLLLLVVSCGSGSGGGSSASSTNNTATTTASTTTTTTSTDNSTSNVLTLTVNGSLCSSSSYPNKPCVSVKICAPGTSTCQTITDILLDTGSVGLRIFKQVLSVSLTQETVSSGSLAECVQYGDGTSDWGQISSASVILGNEPAVNVPVQVIDYTYANPPSSCRGALVDQSPSEAGFNGILGVGPFLQDCGSDCVNSSQNGMYYSCSGSSCRGIAAPLSSQVQNPVALLPQDNNGVIIQLPSVNLGGTTSANGYLVLGIGTRSNNSPSSVIAYTIDQTGEFTTTFNGSSYTSFLDTGSNGLFFTAPSATELPDCSYPNNSWFCPSSTKSFTATNKEVSGSTSGNVSFQIGNYDNLTSTSNNVFVEIGGDGGGQFDWGLPFHFGRSVYYGIEGTTSSIGTGPYFAY